MALVLPLLEKLGKDKHVESLWFPRLDEGSIPSSSTNNIDNQVFILFTPQNAPWNKNDSLIIILYIKSYLPFLNKLTIVMICDILF